ncbi:MAG TPA: hydroxysqualene dehydroxylase HpnE [Terriglobales bacterium]|nr:hydroxysqualene dehydroxylase HpnE [Terriglobales bacterium]
MTSGWSGSVAVVGGGLAGLAAACALADSGYQVRLLERRPYLGGRASSYQHPGTGEVVDNCQHVLLGCCTNLIDFYRRIGVEDRIRWYDRLVFLEPGGRRSVIEPSFLPAPLHNAPSFLGSHALELKDKLAIARAMLSLAGPPPLDSGEPFLDWLRQHGQTERAIERFWKVVLVSALNEDLDRVSSHYAAQVFRESFLKSARAGRMGLPTIPLSDLYSAAGDYIRARGGVVELRTAAEAVRPDSAQVTLSCGGKEITADFTVLALPFQALAPILPGTATGEELRDRIGHFGTSPITGIHLWFDRAITDLDHAVLLDRTIQWMVHKSSFQLPVAGRQLPGESSVGSYVELVVSSSKSLVDMGRNEILDLALRELAEFFPEVRNAKVLKSTVIKEVHATYAPLPGTDAHRPGQATGWPRVFLAGDWTQTGWPATMEGAVRSGYLAAEALTRGQQNPRKFLVPDLPPRGLMRLFG